MFARQKCPQREEDRQRVEDVPEKEPEGEREKGKRSEEQRECGRVFEVVARLVEPQSVQVIVANQIPERRPKNRIVVGEAEDAALNRYDQRSGHVNGEERPLIEDQFDELWLQIPWRQEIPLTRIAPRKTLSALTAYLR